MQLIDTHTHIYDEAFDEDRDATIRRAIEAGVSPMFLPAIDSTTTQRQELLVDNYPENFFEMAGLHPTSVKENFEEELKLVQHQLFHGTRKYVAVGEIGLDFYWDRTFEQEQIEVLRRQIEWAKELHLPIALHIRKAHNELFNLLKKLNYKHYDGVMHCFGGSVQEAQKAIELGFYIGVGGVVTFKNATLANVVAAIPLEKILLETDSPYLAPVPHRGKRNESAYVVEVAKKIAEIKQLPLEAVAEQTTQNAKALFCNKKL